jgi:glycosyltransferase involved in cell wall biosynthesis
MRVKVLETLAAGKALVASSRAVEGFAVRDGHELLIADTDEEFCAAISELLADEDRRVEVARAARAWAEGQADAHRTASAFDSLYRELLSARE